MRELKRDSYQADPEAKKQKEKDSYQAKPEAKKQIERDSYQAKQKKNKKKGIATRLTLRPRKYLKEPRVRKTANSGRAQCKSITITIALTCCLEN